MPRCKGTCKWYAARNQSDNAGYHDRKRCTTCAVYVGVEYHLCPCCGTKLRTTPRYYKR